MEILGWLFVCGVSVALTFYSFILIGIASSPFKDTVPVPVRFVVYMLCGLSWSCAYKLSPVTVETKVSVEELQIQELMEANKELLKRLDAKSVSE